MKMYRQSLGVALAVVASTCFAANNNNAALEKELKLEKKLSKKQFRIEQKQERRNAHRQRKKTHKLERQMRREQRLEAIQEWKVQRRALVKEQQFAGKFADLYINPAWPVYAWTFDHRALLSTELVFNDAQKACDASGKQKDLSHVAFGTESFKLEDILLASRLSALNVVAPVSAAEDDFLSYLAPTQFSLNASAHSYAINIDLVRYLYKKDIAIGMHLPLIHKSHVLDIDTCLPTGVLDNMTLTKAPDGTPFRRLFGGSFAEFFRQILAGKGMVYKRVNTQFGPGDISLYANAMIYSRKWERMITGLRLTLPTGQNANTKELWAPALGTGIPQVSFFWSLLMAMDYKINPHVLIDVTYNVPSYVRRRTPRMVANDGTKTGALNGVIFGDNVTYRPGVSFNQPDSRVNPFANTIQRIRVSKGFEVNLRLGNVFEKFLFRRGFLDVSYDLKFWQHHDVGTKGCANMVDSCFLEVDSGGVSHTVGIDYSYQFDSSTRAHWGLTYLFAGHNVAHNLNLITSFQIDF